MKKSIKIMVKNSRLAIVIVLCTCICGCSLHGDAQYNEKTNQHILIFDIEFQIPVSWLKEVDNQDFQGFAEWSKSGMLMNSLGVTFEQDTMLSERADEILYGFEAQNEKGIKIENINQSKITIESMSAEKIEYTQNTGNKIGYSRIILLQKDNGIIEINFYTQNKSGLDDFDNVIDSIRIIT